MMSSDHQPLLTPSEGDRAENRLFPSYNKVDVFYRAQHRLFPSHPSQDLTANRAEHRSLTAESEEKQQTKHPSTRKDLKETKLKKIPALLFRRRQRSLNPNYASAPSSGVIFPDEPPVTVKPKTAAAYGPISTGSDLQVSSGQTAYLPEDKKLSTAGKFVLGGLSVLESIFSPPPPPPPTFYQPLLASSALSSSPSPLHPSYPAFLFPGPSALYPNIAPPYPMPLDQNNYYNVPSPYQALSVDSLLIPLVGLVGLSLLVPDIIKTRREGRPSDIEGLDVYRHLSQDGECLRRLACEAGVAVSDADDNLAIQRALGRALSAKRVIPESHVGHHHQRVTKSQCGQHSCAAWITDNAEMQSTFTTKA